ncbi:hypothetical protein MMC26_005921 [Xylographa opegraphella]|nr:hypothetical protein [Xylographa opegraphella]
MAELDPAAPLGDKGAALQPWQGEPVESNTEGKKLNWSQRILKQGPWDEVNDPLPLTGAPAIPAPLHFGSTKSLAPLLSHLAIHGREDLNTQPYYGTKMPKFEAGTVYEDGRLNVCKFPVGAKHIKDLMERLDQNDLVRHFLAGNNLMGRAGANSIAEFVRAHPDRMETWYIAGNCFDAYDLRILAAAWMHSPVITNIWLKRNPLRPAALPILREIITHVPKLRTLDLDQTELGNDAVEQLFTFLAEKAAGADRLALRNLYLNATGIGASACSAIASYLGHPNCTLESLYLNNNPIGTSGLLALCHGPALAQNRSLVRLCLASCGLTSDSVSPLLRALTGHPTLSYLDLGQSYATDDPNARYNYLSSTPALTPALTPTLTTFITQTPHLHHLNLGTAVLAHADLERLASAVLRSPSLLAYVARSAVPALKTDALRRRVRDAALREHLWRNVQRGWPGVFKSYVGWEAEELRWLRSPRDVRMTDSVSRNREAGVARRGRGKEGGGKICGGGW